jgi:opacity protein-like surface antigen
MRILLRLVVLVVSLLASSIAAADDSGWYVGFELGSAKASAMPYAAQESFLGSAPPSQPKITNISSSSLNSTSSNLEGGYWFNSYVGLQAGLLDLGSYSGSLNFKNDYSHFTIDDSRKLKAYGIVLAVTGRYPLSEDFDLLGRAGVFSSRTTFDEEDISNSFPPVETHVSETESATVLGAGLGWNFASHWEAQLRYDRYSNLGGGDFGKFDVRTYSLAVQYHF